MKKIYNKFHSLPIAVKASAAYFLANIITKGIAYITTPIYTRLLPSEVVGQVSVFMTWVHIFGILATLHLSHGVFNNGMLDFREKRDEFAYSTLLLSSVLTLAFTFVFLIAYPFIRPYINMDYLLVILMLGEFFTQPAYLFWSARQRYEYKYKKVLIATLFLAVATPIVTVFTILNYKTNLLHARLLGAFGIAIAFYIGFYVYIILKGRGKVSKAMLFEHWKYAILFNLPLVPHFLSTYLLSNSDKIMIKAITGYSDAAYYSIAYSVAAVVTIVWSAANSSLTPFVYEKCRAKEYKSISKVSLSVLALFGIACIVIILLAPEIVMAMSTPEYRSAMYVIPPLVGGVFFHVQYYLYAKILYCLKKPKFIMYASIITTLLNIVLNYVFISKFGYIAAGYTTLFCYMLQAAMTYFIMNRIVKERIYNMRYIGIMSVAVIIISIFSNITYNYVLVRYFVIGAIAVLAVVFRKKIIEIFNSMKKKA